MKQILDGIEMQTSDDDDTLILAIAQRADELTRRISPRAGLTPLHWAMDLTACHLVGCPLDLAGLLRADNADFAHDIGGINQHLDRKTGKLNQYFVPRYAAKYAWGVGSGQRWRQSPDGQWKVEAK